MLSRIVSRFLFSVSLYHLNLEKYFLKYLFLFKHNKNRATDEKFYDFKYLFEVFNQEKFDNFIEKEKDTIESFVINNENMKKRWEDFLLKYDEFKKAKKD